MADVLKKIGDGLAKVWKTLTLDGLNTRRDNALERFLSGSADVHDLEAREREWSRKMQHRNLY